MTKGKSGRSHLSGGVSQSAAFSIPASGQNETFELVFILFFFLVSFKFKHLPILFCFRCISAMSLRIMLELCHIRSFKHLENWMRTEREGLGACFIRLSWWPKTWMSKKVILHEISFQYFFLVSIFCAIFTCLSPVMSFKINTSLCFTRFISRGLYAFILSCFRHLTMKHLVFLMLVKS